VGAAVIARALVALAVALPWLVVAPLSGVAAAAAQVLVMLAAFHGAGLAVAWLADRREAPPLVAVQWGIAALIGLSGIAIAARAGTRSVQLALVFGGAAVHSAVLAVHARRFVERMRAALAAPRAWLAPAALLAGLGALTVLGAAGDGFAQPFDDDGQLLGQLRRVLDTGALGDPVGYPRRGGLGAQIALAALASSPGARFAEVIEPLARALALGLALSRLRVADATGALWAAVLVAAGYGLALAPFDPLPCWTAVGLCAALYQLAADDDPPALPLALTAGALAALRFELVPIAAVGVIAAWWRRPRDARRAAVLLGGALAVVLPFAIARAAAWWSLPHAAAAAVGALAAASRAASPAASPAPLAVRAALTAAIALPAAALLRLALPGRALATAATATAAALGAVVAHLAVAGPYSVRLAWPIAIGFAVALVTELARSRRSGPAALIVTLLLCAVIHDGLETAGHRRWPVRLAAAATDLGYVRRPPATAAPYAALLTGVPAGATVAVWVAEPERLDHARHRIVDLRTPGTARLHEPRWRGRAPAAAPLLAALGADYLLIEADDARVLKTQTDVFYRWLCQTPELACDDDLEAVARDHPVAAARPGLRLIDLRAAQRAAPATGS
jgi:hypothetical protein